MDGSCLFNGDNGSTYGNCCSVGLCYHGSKPFILDQVITSLIQVTTQPKHLNLVVPDHDAWNAVIEKSTNSSRVDSILEDWIASRFSITITAEMCNKEQDQIVV